MRTKVARYLIQVVICMATIGGAGAAAADKPARTTTVVGIHIENPTLVPESMLMNAERHVESIYRRIGVRIVWLDRISANETFGIGNLELSLVMVSAALEATVSRTGYDMGFALSNEGKGVRRAYILFSRIQTFAAKSNSQAARSVFAAVIAHEIGHLLLPHDAHSDVGIMRARFRTKDFDPPNAAGFLFSSNQGAFIRNTVAVHTPTAMASN